MRDSSIVFFDKNYHYLIRKLTDKKVQIFWYNRGNIDFFLLLKIFLSNIFSPKPELKLKYIINKLRKLNPKIILTFQDTNDLVFTLSKSFKDVKFIVVQNSFRPKGYYGEKKLKETDVFLKYSPLVEFNLCNNEYAIKTFKYFDQKFKTNMFSGIIFISQYREYNNYEFKRAAQSHYRELKDLKISQNFNHFIYEKIFLKYLSKFSISNDIKMFYKSASRTETNFDKKDESKYFEKFGIKEIEITTIECLNSCPNVIFICIDSTMIFELLSHGRKVLIYPYRKLFDSLECDPHLKIFCEMYPELTINKEINDFEYKYKELKSLKQKEYHKKISLFYDLPKFNLNNFL